MNNIENSIDLFQTLAPGLEQEKLNRAQQKLGKIIKVGTQVLEQVQIPVITNDEEVRKYVEQFQLQKPKNMIRFFVEAYFSTIEGLSESINELKLVDLENSIAKVKSAKSLFDMGMDNPKLLNEKLSSAQEKLLDATEELKGKIRIYIQKIRSIDNRPRWQFFLKSHQSVVEIDITNYCAKYALETLFQAISMQMLIAEQLEGFNISNSVILPFQQFVKAEILSKDTCSLMHAYDKDKNKEFWLKINEKVNFINEIQEQLEDYSEQAEGLDEYDDIDFS